MNHSTKWNRVTVNKPLESRLYNARAKYLNDFDRLPDQPAKGIQSTVHPDGIVINNKMLNV